MEWIDKQIQHFNYLMQNRDKISDYEIKEAYDTFYDGVYVLYEKYKTKHLTKFCLIGMEYDGYMPGNNANFIALYEQLINMIKDKKIDKPIRYYAEVHEELVLMEEDEQGNKMVVQS